MRSRGAEIADLKAFLIARLEKRLSENKATEAELKRMLAEKCKLRTEENVECVKSLDGKICRKHVTKSKAHRICRSTFCHKKGIFGSVNRKFKTGTRIRFVNLCTGLSLIQ